jgi:transcriptional regulator with XRE-family HTH domain
VKTSPDYSEELRAIREYLGLTQARLGLLLGIAQNSIMRYERGFRKVPEPTIRLAMQLVHMQGSYKKGTD